MTVTIQVSAVSNVHVRLCLVKIRVLDVGLDQRRLSADYTSKTYPRENTEGETIMTSIRPHGGTLVNRVVEGTEREELLQLAREYKTLAVNTWTLSDLDLIAVGAFSPLTGFLNEQDYHSVVKNMRLADGTVWSIPITLAVEEDVASGLAIGDKVSLIGEEDGEIYGFLILRVFIRLIKTLKRKMYSKQQTLNIQE